MKQKIKVKKSSRPQTTLEKTLKSSIIGFLITVLIALALILLGTTIAYATSDPTAFIVPIGYITLYLSAFFGGFVCAKLNKRAPYQSASLSCLAFVMLTSLLALIGGGSSHQMWLVLLLRALLFPVHFFGAALGSKASGGKPKYRARKRK